MGLFDLSQVKNHPHRSGFDLSGRRCFTAKVGELLPVDWHLCLPGEKYPIKTQHFTRLQPVNTCAMTRIREHIETYFVPLRLINKNLPSALVEISTDELSAVSAVAGKKTVMDLPHTTLKSISDYLFQQAESKFPKNVFGFDKARLSFKLLRMLRYGNFMDPKLVSKGVQILPSKEVDYFDRTTYKVNSQVNILPLLAYQKIYSDYKRNPQWEKAESNTCNVDFYEGGDILSGVLEDKDGLFLKNNNWFTLRYVDRQKDLFFGQFPHSQLGSAALIGDPSEFQRLGVLQWPNGTQATGKLEANGQSTLSGHYGSVGSELALVTKQYTTAASVIQLRVAEALQKYREVSMIADPNYRSQILAHFGVSLARALSNQCEYVCGSSSNIDISEVVNQSFEADESFADIKGKGVGSSTSGGFYEAKEHGILMQVYYATPLQDYIPSGQPAQLLCATTKDLPKPEFDSIGLEGLPLVSLMNTSQLAGEEETYAKRFIGYVPRYAQYKTNYDTVTGAFETTLKSWVTPIDSSVFKSVTVGADLETPTVTYNYFKINPSSLDNIFQLHADSYWDTDHFQVCVFNDVKAVKNFDYDGMPY